MQKPIFIFLLLFSGAATFGAMGQLVAEGALLTAETDYATTTPDDKVFCFAPGSSMMIRFEGENFQSIRWYRHNPADNSWDNFVAGGNQQLVVPETGGYRVQVVEEGGQSVEERFWVYNMQGLNQVDVAIEYDDCFGVELAATSDSVPLLFYDPANGTPGGIAYHRQYSWGTIPPGDEQPSGNRVSFNAPYDDVTFVVTVTDRFGHEKEAAVDYQAKAVKAAFETEILKDAPEHERHDEARGSAPLEILFSDQSEGHVTAREWTFGDAGRSVARNPRFVFSEAGKDSVTLRVINRDSGCEDMTDPFVVNVMESELDVPNVFTPNGDGVNDEFRVAYRSLKDFKMIIYNRWGRKVYESTDPAKGWDGSIGGRKAAHGVFFYYIKGKGYNEGEVHEREGAVHLIRDK